MKRLLNILLIVLLAGNVMAACAGKTSSDGTAAASNTAAATPAMPAGDRWLTHLTNELLPFWTMPSALGDPLGAFPSTRCNDGSLVDLQNPCQEVKDNNWVMNYMPYFTVALSRQTYGYGVAFQLTGDITYLQYMKAGVKFIRENVIDRQNGGTFEYYDSKAKQWGPEAPYRDPQELAYAMTGLSFYYYLTRDPEVLPDILAVKDYIFQNYYNSGQDVMQWMLKSTNQTKADSKMLVAQLDQMNAYMVLITPLLPEPTQSQWKSDLVHLSHIIIDQFYVPEENICFLSDNIPQDKMLQDTGVDFGHTIKAMWMIRWTGLLTGDGELKDFAETNGRRVLERAYLADQGTWAGGLKQGGDLNYDIDWWVYAELDQFTATLALGDPTLTAYLPFTYDYYFQYFVDHQYGEVWTTVNAITHEPEGNMMKAWPWKSAYHSFEHTLVGYLTSQQFASQPATLYYAFVAPPSPEDIHPYFFSAAQETSETVNEQGTTVYKVTFTGIQ
jgi:mannose/cellobiose epimerase-like protein (N-acyl-D-glucosamine 2-epimerase family)